jgi:hypothetical protein
MSPELRHLLIGDARRRAPVFALAAVLILLAAFSLQIFRGERPLMTLLTMVTLVVSATAEEWRTVRELREGRAPRLPAAILTEGEIR